MIDQIFYAIGSYCNLQLGFVVFGWKIFVFYFILFFVLFIVNCFISGIFCVFFSQLLSRNTLGI